MKSDLVKRSAGPDYGYDALGIMLGLLLGGGAAAFAGCLIAALAPY